MTNKAKNGDKIPAKVKDEVASGISELYLRFSCDYCQEDIPGLRIKCVDCADFDLCLPCFACGAQIGKHKNTHKYLFMNNGGFQIFPPPLELEDQLSGYKRNKRLSSLSSNVSTQLGINTHGGSSSSNGSGSDQDSSQWNAREEMRLLDAVEQWGYGNWKEISAHIETKSPDQVKEEYIKHYIYGLVGKHTWKEELRGYAVDHTQAADRGPLSPTLTGKLPPINVNNQEALLLGYLPHRDDYEDFDKETENLVSQIKDKSVDDEEVDVALKLAQCDIYERKLREQVRRKRVARDYQLVGKFYTENPIIEIGGGKKFAPLRITNTMRETKKSDGPKQELIESLKPLTQYNTAQEYYQLINNLCVEKELKVRVKELHKYRENGLTKVDQLCEFESARFKHQLKLKRWAKAAAASATPGGPSQQAATNAKFLPTYGDYSLKAILDPDYENKLDPQQLAFGKKKRKKATWSRKKMKTGRRLLLSKGGCILTLASPKRRDSTDTN